MKIKEKESFNHFRVTGWSTGREEFSEQEWKQVIEFERETF
jgi:hypothetical protein